VNAAAGRPRRSPRARAPRPASSSPSTRTGPGPRDHASAATRQQLARGNPGCARARHRAAPPGGPGGPLPLQPGKDIGRQANALQVLPRPAPKASSSPLFASLVGRPVRSRHPGMRQCHSGGGVVTGGMVIAVLNAVSGLGFGRLSRPRSRSTYGCGRGRSLGGQARP
jgi:hypothetical protein